MNRSHKLSIGALLLMLVPFLSACGADATATAQPVTIRVASKDFTEEFIVGNMYADLLENAGFKVDRKMNLGGTPVCQAALVSNQIDVYPEYTGTGLTTVLKQPVQSDPTAVYNAVQAGYKQFNLTWLQAAPMNDTQAIAMTKAKADELGIKTVSDFVAKASQITLVGAPEFQEREDGIPGLKKVYGDFTLKSFLSVDAALRYPSLLNGQADATVAYSTDGPIAANNLVVLEDDKHLWPPYQLAPVIRQDILTANPKIADALNALAPKLTNDVMSNLNNEVDGKKREPADVAKEFLQNQGLLPK